MLPVLVTGSREPLVPAVARALIRSLERLRGRQRRTRVIEDLEAQASAVILSADHSKLLELLDGVGSYATERGWSGLFVVLDELGKFLEYAALHPDEEDLYILQRLAEGCVQGIPDSLWLYLAFCIKASTPTPKACLRLCDKNGKRWPADSARSHSINHSHT